MQVSHLSEAVSIAVAAGHHRAEDRRLVGERQRESAVRRAGVAGQPGRRDVRADDGDGGGAPARRGPPLRPPQGGVLFQRLRRRADLRRGAGHHLGRGATPVARRSRWKTGGLGPGAVGRQLDDEWRAGLDDDEEGARGALDGARRPTPATCSPTCGPRWAWSLGLLAVLASPAGCGWTRVIAIARGAEHPARRLRRSRLRSSAEGPDGPGRWSPTSRADHRQGAGRVRPPDDPLRPRDDAPRRRSAVSWICTCTCQRGGRWAGPPPCAHRSSRRLMSAVPGLRATIQLLPMDVEAHFGDPARPDLIALRPREGRRR